MRLICPNCDAQYEVPDEVMPVAGRDVQCSNCGQTWFQHHPDHEPPEDADWPPDAAEETAAGEAGPTSDHSDREATPEPQQPPAAKPAREEFPNLRAAASGRAAQAGPSQTATDDEEDEDSDPPASAAPARRKLDPAVAEILRQEAAAEQEARRRRQSDPLESQPELGLEQGWSEEDSTTEDSHDHADDDDERAESDGLATRDMSAERRAYEARVRMARMRGEPDPVDPASAEAAGPRRNLLPDIEEINSTLRHEREGGTRAGPTPTAAQDAPVPEQKSGGFMRGFTLMLALAAILALIYAYAPQIAQSLPQTDPYLSSYVATMDDARLWLDRQLQALLVWLDTLAAQSQG